MAGISDQAALSEENNYLFNGKLLNHKEFSDNTGLDWYSYGMREYDPQIGRFFRVDPIAEKFYELTPYQYASNDPVSKIDLDGGEGIFFQIVNPYLIQKTVQNPEGWQAKTLGVEAGVGGSIMGVAKGFAHPIAAAKGLGRMLTQSPGANAADYGLSLYSQYGNSGSDAFTEYAMYAHVLTDVAMALSPLKMGRVADVGSVWDMNPLERGLEIENRLGGNLPKNFPVIDKFSNGVATSIKSIDLTAETYTKGNNLFNTLKGYVNKLGDFNGKTFDGVTVKGSEINSKVLDVAIKPGTATLSQWEQISKSMQYAKDNNIQFNLQFIK